MAWRRWRVTPKMANACRQRSRISIRRGIGEIMSGWVERDEISGQDAARYLHAIAHGNVERVYGLGDA